MGVDAKRLFFRSSPATEQVTPEVKAYQRWVSTSDKKLEEAEKSNIYPRFRTFTDSDSHNLFEIRKLPDTTYVISVLISTAGLIRPDSAIVLRPDKSVHMLDAVFVPGQHPKTEWVRQPFKNEGVLGVLEYRLDRAKLFDTQIQGKWRGGFQPTDEILAGLKTS